MSLQSKFFLYFLAFAVLPLLVTGTVVFSITKQRIERDTIEHLALVADLSSKRLNNTLDHYADRAKLVASRTQLRASLEEYGKTRDKKTVATMQKILLDTKNSVDNIDEITIRDISGTVAASTNPSRTVEHPRSEHPPSAKSFYPDLIFKDESNTLHLRILGPLVLNEQDIGTLEMILPADEIMEITSDYLGLGESGEIMLVAKHPDGGAIFLTPLRFDADAALTRTVSETKVGDPVLSVLSGEEKIFIDQPVTDYRKVSVLAATRFIPATGWGMVAKVDRDDALAAVAETRDIYLFTIIFTLLLVAFLSIVFSQSITSPILELARVSLKLKTADFSEQATATSTDEIGQLADAFNEMSEKLKKSYTEMEDRVKERTKELEAFSYSVSHDLRSPLRAIDGFSKILVEEHGKDLSTEGKRLIDIIQANTHQMGELIDDLLDFSHFGRQEVKTRTVNMTELVKSAYDELKATVPDRHIEFIMGDLPKAQADPALLRHVWVNYLNNAIKFTRPRKEKARIEVGGKIDKEKNEIVYFAKDNGAGFNMQYVNKLFGVFQRLHTAEEFEGSGVGLAIVSRIVTKHGGRAWGEGSVDQGATFYFTLPEKHE